jgi:hypothetical protein
VDRRFRVIERKPKLDNLSKGRPCAGPFAFRIKQFGGCGENRRDGLETCRVARPRQKNILRDLPAGSRPELGMEQSIRKFRPDVGVSMNLMLALALVAACSVNALLLLAHL